MMTYNNFNADGSGFSAAVKMLSQISDSGNVSMNVRPTITRIIGYATDPAPQLSEFGQDVQNLVPQIHVSES